MIARRYYSVFVSNMTGPPVGELESEMQAASWKCIADGPCEKDRAIAYAKECVIFGPWKRVRVFTGKTAGKLIYEAYAASNDEPEEVAS